jgi:hypothetical protein
MPGHVCPAGTANACSCPTWSDVILQTFSEGEVDECINRENGRLLRLGFEDLFLISAVAPRLSNSLLWSSCFTCSLVTGYIAAENINSI